MRAKLRQRVSFKDENQSKIDQDDFSFKSKTKDLEKKISELKVENSKRDNSILYDQEHSRMQNETKNLIKKTKNLMENLNLNEIKNKNTSKSVSKEKTNNLNNLSMSFDNRMKRSFNEEINNNESKRKSDFYSSQKNYNLTNYSQHVLNMNSNSNYLNNSHSNLGNEILLKNHKSISIEHMSSELIEYKKKIQKLEKELKEKNNLVKKLNSKIDLKNSEIANLNEIINKENSTNFKAEIATLTRKLNAREKAFEDSKKNFEKVIDEYKVQMTDLIRFNDCSTLKIKELEDQRDKFREMIRKLENENLDLNSKVGENIDLYEEERKIKDNLRSDYEYLKEKVKKMVLMLKDLQSSKETNKIEGEKFFNNLFKFYSE